MQNLNSSLKRVAVSMKSMTSGSRVFSKEIVGAQKCYVYVEKLIAAMATSQTNSNSVVNKRVLEDSGGGPMAKYRRVRHEAVKPTSTIEGFKTINDMAATYEQTKKGLSYFYPKR